VRGVNIQCRQLLLLRTVVLLQNDLHNSLLQSANEDSSKFDQMYSQVVYFSTNYFEAHYTSE